MAEHTPPPWEIDEHDPAVIWGPDGLRIASLTGSTIVAGEDNAAFIVRACNAHDDLVATLERIALPDLRFHYDADDFQEWARTALAKVGGS